MCQQARVGILICDMANQWFKFYGGEYLSDPKMAALSPQERSCWLTLLCLASMSTVQGEIGFLTVEVLLTKSGIEFDPYNPEQWNNNLGVLKKFEQMKMVSLNDDGSISIKNWEKRQEHNLTVAERVAKSRRNKKDVTMNVTNVTTEENRIDKSIYITADAEEKTSRKPKDKNAQAIIREVEELLGRKFTNPVAQMSAISRMLTAGYTKQQIIDEYDWLLDQEYWKNKGVDFLTVASQIHKEHE